MPETSCPDFARLSAYHQRTLSVEESSALARHLEQCGDCRSIVASFEHSELPSHTMVPSSSETASMPPQTPEPPEPPEPAALRELGEYRLLEKLGEGGMGTVYKALHTRLDKIVALKMLRERCGADESLAIRFDREMKAAGRVSHPNVIQAYDAREIAGTRILVTEFVDGIDLSEALRRHGPLPIADACELTRQAALGLQAAHELGLVHRDIKPSNLMLTRQGQVKVLDLGLARLHAAPMGAGELTFSGQIMGTADFMAPEQVVDCHNVDIRADIYSLGCTLYKLLTGQTPFSGTDCEAPFAKMTAHVMKPVPPIRQLRRTVPAPLAALVHRMLAKERAERFATPGEVAEALKPFATGCNLSALWQLKAEAPGPRQTAGTMIAPDAEMPNALDEKSGRAIVHLPDELPSTKEYRPTGGRGLRVVVGILILGAVGGAASWWANQYFHRSDSSAAKRDSTANQSPPAKQAAQQPTDRRDHGSPQVDSRPKGKPQSATEFQPVMKAESKPEHKPESNAEAKPATNVEAKTDSKSPATTRTKPVVKPQTKAEAKPQSKAETKPAAKVEAKTESKPQTAIVTKSAAKVETKPVPAAPAIAVAPFDAKQARALQEQWASHLNQPIEQTNSINMRLVLIPPGEFTMGTADDNRAPAHRVAITRPFLLGTYEVTQAEYQQVMGSNPSHFSLHGDGRGTVAGKDTRRHPVESVGWAQAAEFCRKLSALAPEQTAGRSYRLPTEAEWEYACRAGTQTAWYCGDSAEAAVDYGWFDPHADGMTQPVGQKKPNPWGLFDVLGNVSEWCHDWYDEKYLEHSPAEDPPGPASGLDHVVRGGSIVGSAAHCRSAARRNLSEGYLWAGFRVLCEVPTGGVEYRKAAAAPGTAPTKSSPP